MKIYILTLFIIFQLIGGGLYSSKYTIEEYKSTNQHSEQNHDTHTNHFESIESETSISVVDSFVSSKNIDILSILLCFSISNFFLDEIAKTSKAEILILL